MADRTGRIHFKFSSNSKIISNEIDNLKQKLSEIGVTQTVIGARTEGTSDKFSGFTVSLRNTSTTAEQTAAAYEIVSQAMKRLNTQATVNIRRNETGTKTITVNAAKHQNLAANIKSAAKSSGTFSNLLKIQSNATRGLISATAKAGKTLVSAFGKQVIGVIKRTTSGIKSLVGAVTRIPTAPLRAFFNTFANSNIMSIIAGMIGYHGIRSIGRSIKNLGQQTGAIQSVRVTFANFVQQATAHISGFNESADTMIKKMQQITNGALDTTSMLKNANLAFSLIGDQAGTHMPKMLQIAQASALATGQEFDYMFQSLVKAAGRLSTRWADNLGITLSTTEAYQRYAQEINTTADALTHQQRVTAMLNELMRKGEDVILKVGDAQLFLKTQTQALGSSFKDMRDEVISDVAPLFTVIIGYINDFINNAKPKILNWVQGFMDAFAQMPSAVDRAAKEMAGMSPLFVQQAMQPIKQGSEMMGYHAAEWAVNAASWGANVMAQFASGMIQGFAAAVVAAMNMISSVLAHWLSPGSPPRVAPMLDVWGEEAMGEWVQGMLNYPIEKELPKIAGDLKKVLEGGVKDALFQSAIDSLAGWTKGMSQLDMEFILDSLDRALNKAKELNKVLTKSYKEQRTELFKLQVLNKDPAGVRAQLNKVKATKKSLKANEAEINTLEARKKIVRDQLDLMRLLLRAMDDMAKKSGGAGRKGRSGGAGDLMQSMPEFNVATPLAGTSDLAKRIAGIKETLSGIFEDPLEQIQTSWNDAFGEGSDFQTSLSTLQGQFAAVEEAGGLGSVIENWIRASDAGNTLWVTGENILDSVTSLIDGVQESGGLRSFAEDLLGSSENGKKFLGIIESVSEFFQGGGFMDAVGEVGSYFEDVLAPAIEIVKPPLIELWDTFKEAAGDINWGQKLKALATVLGSIFITAIAVATGVLNGLVKAFRWIIVTQKKFHDGLVSMGDGFKEIWNGIKNLKIKQIFNGIGKVIMGFIDSVIAWFAGPFAAIGSLIWGIITGIIGYFKELYDKIVGHSIIPDLIEKMKDLWNSGVQFILDLAQHLKNQVIVRFRILKSKLRLLWYNIKTKAVEVWENLKNSIITKVLTIKEQVQEKINAIKIWLEEQIDKWKQVGKDLIQGLKDGIKAELENIAEAIVGPVLNAIEQLKQLTSTHSPSRVMMDIGSDIMQGLVLGMEKFASVPTDIIGDTAGFAAMSPAMASGRATPATSAVTHNVYVSGPIVERVVVPNRQASRQFAKDIATEISDMTNVRRR